MDPMIAFLIASFISSFGDTLLVLALPTGLGLETGDMRSAILLWLIPACAMLVSALAAPLVRRRLASARTDYAFILLGIASLELVFAASTFVTKTSTQLVISTSIFIFLYAVAREGLPRVLYNVSLPGFFRGRRSYESLAGYQAGMSMAASLVGGIAAASLVASGGWRWALPVDALTFVVLGFVVLRFGADIPNAQGHTSSAALSRDVPGAPSPKLLSTVATLIPMTFATNALIWNYLPLLSQRAEILPAATGVFAVACVRIPGVVAGFLFEKLNIRLSKSTLLIGAWATFFCASLVFAHMPSLPALIVLIVAQGLYGGIAIPADLSIRSRLPASSQIAYNQRVLIILAGAQFVACMAALFVYAPGQEVPKAIPLILLVIGSIIVMINFWHFRIIRSLAVIGCGLAFGMVAIRSQTAEHDRRTVVGLPSVSRDLTLNKNLTYAGMALLNDTGARLFRVSHDLTVVPEVFSHFEELERGRRFKFYLDKQYQSERGEGVSTDDVVFTIKYYLALLPDLAGSLKSIAGAENCASVECDLVGIKAGSESVEIELVSADRHFVDSLSSPWLIVHKRGKPAVERIGDCLVPYQTGTWRIVACDQSGVVLQRSAKQVVVRATKDITSIDDQMDVRILLSDNPTTETAPGLTVMALFANPARNEVDSTSRSALTKILADQAPVLARELKLVPSRTFMPRWIGADVASKVVSSFDRGTITCPKEPIKFLLDASLPDHKKLSSFFRQLPCPIEVLATNGDTYFQEFSKVDFGVAWFTPDFLDFYNVYNPFDCSKVGLCYFDWNDAVLQIAIDRVRIASEGGIQDINGAVAVEQRLMELGAVVPLAEMNWWIAGRGQHKAIHPAGLFQLRISEFL